MKLPSYAFFGLACTEKDEAGLNIKNPGSIDLGMPV